MGEVERGDSSPMREDRWPALVRAIPGVTLEDLQRQYWELYRAHVCSSALRVGRELLGLLPVQFAIVHVAAPVLNPSTGHQEELAVPSVGFARETMARLSFDTVDPAAAMKNFVHRIDFKKTKGLGVVERLVPDEFRSPGRTSCA